MKKTAWFVVLVLILLGLTAPALAEENKWSFGGLLGWYSPDYGEVNDKLHEINDYWRTDLGLDSGPILGLTASYQFSPNFRLRGEIAKFRAETSDTGTLSGGYWYYWWYYSWEETLEFDGELIVTPVIVSGVYIFPEMSSPKFSLRPYLGAGIGQFITKGKVSAKYEYDEWLDSYHIYHEEWPIEDEDTDKPLGIQLLGGVEGELSENVSFGIEARYIVAEAELESRKLGLFGKKEIEVDLGGLMLTGSLLIKF